MVGGRRAGASPRRASGGASWAAAAAVALATITGATEGVAGADGPFNVLEWSGDVVTSRNGYSVWVSVGSSEHRATIPGHEREVSLAEHTAVLHVSCRAAGGGLPERFPPKAAHGGIYLDNHPEQPGAYTVLHPMHWVLEIQGRDEERWPVEVTIGDNPPVATELVRSLTNYSAARPGLDIALPGEALIDAILNGSPIRIEADGADMRLVARFTASANARRAAKLMRNACPPAATMFLLY